MKNKIKFRNLQPKNLYSIQTISKDSIKFDQMDQYDPGCDIHAQRDITQRYETKLIGTLKNNDIIFIIDKGISIKEYMYAQILYKNKTGFIFCKKDSYGEQRLRFFEIK